MRVTTCLSLLLATVRVPDPEVQDAALFGERASRQWSRSRPVWALPDRAAGEVKLAELLQQHGPAPQAPAPMPA